MTEARLREQLRLTVYRRFAADGRPPSVHELAQEYQLDLSQTVRALQALAEQRHLVLSEPGPDAGSVTILMAHPFSAVPLGFSVMGPSTLWWGGCAWDSFALPHLLPDVAEVLVATTCPGCGAAHAFRVDTQAPPTGEQVAHFLIPALHMWDDVLRTCGNQRIFCSTTCVDDWLTASEQSRGYVMDLTTLWQLAEHWYDGRLESGYSRREPAASAEYLRGVGLTGSFWSG